jgi:NAD(P)H-dependent FMN reductase
MTTKIHLFSISASEQSVSRSCCKNVELALKSSGANVLYRDVRDLPPIWVNGTIPTEYAQKYGEVAEELAQCDGYVLFLPVHCYSMSSVCKAITEIFFTPLKRKPIGFVVAAGGRNSYLAVRDMMNSLIFDSESFIFPKQVYLTEGDLTKEFQPNSEVSERLELFSKDFLSFVGAVKGLAL